MTETIFLDNYKYKIIRTDGITLVAYRNNEAWRDMTGDKMINCLFDLALNKQTSHPDAPILAIHKIEAERLRLASQPEYTEAEIEAAARKTWGPVLDISKRYLSTFLNHLQGRAK